MGKSSAGDLTTDPSETDIRIRSVSTWQLSFAAVVASIVALAAVLDSSVIETPEAIVGIAGVLLTTVAALLIPWGRLPSDAVASLPFLGILWVGLLTFDTDVRLSHLWVFPIMWLASLFSLPLLVTGLGGIAVIGAVEVVFSLGSVDGALRVVIVVFALTFVGATVHLTARQELAYRALLRRQAVRTRAALDGVRDERRRVRETLEDVNIAIARVNRSGDLVTANSAYRALYAIPGDDLRLPAQSVEYDGLRGSAVRATEVTLARAARGESLNEERVWLYRPDSDWRALAVTAQPATQQPGEEPSTVVVAEDVTDRLEADRRRHALAAVISHELRNPLTAVVGQTDRLIEDESLPDSARERLSVIEESAERMMHVISGVLSGPPETSGAVMRPAWARVDLGRIVEDSAEYYATAARESGIALSVSVPAPVTVWGDAFRLRQLADNLLGNAVKYTPPGGTVSVSLVDVEGLARLVVDDSGIGIDAPDLPRVFEHGYRGSNAVASAVAGTGVGLGVVRQVLDSHGGRVDVASTPGVGTVVTVDIPMEAE